MPEDLPRTVLALGAYTLDRGGKRIQRGRQAVEAAARRSFPDPRVKIVSIAELADFDELFDPTVEQARQSDLMKLAGAASGQFIQQALEGEIVTDIHVDLTGIDDALEQSQAASELRNLIAHLRSQDVRCVSIHFLHADGLSTIGMQGDAVTGAPLPGVIRKHLSAAAFPDEKQVEP